MPSIRVRYASNFNSTLPHSHSCIQSLLKESRFNSLFLGLTTPSPSSSLSPSDMKMSFRVRSVGCGLACGPFSRSLVVRATPIKHRSRGFEMKSDVMRLGREEGEGAGGGRPRSQSIYWVRGKPGWRMAGNTKRSRMPACRTNTLVYQRAYGQNDNSFCACIS